MFDIGDKVICVNDFFAENDPKLNAILNLFDQLPRKGQEYTVRGVFDTINGPGILLEELSNPPLQFPLGFMEPNFRADRFRKSEKTKIENHELEEFRN